MGRKVVVARLDRGADGDVGVDRVIALVLQRVGLQLVDEPDTPPLVVGQVDHDAERARRDDLHRGLQLRIAVAAQRMEDVPGHAAAVHAHDRQLPRRRAVAVDQHHCLAVRIETLVGASLQLQLTPLELDGEHRLNGPVDIQLNRFDRSTRLHRNLQTRRGALMALRTEPRKGMFCSHPPPRGKPLARPVARPPLPVGRMKATDVGRQLASLTGRRKAERG